MCPGPAWSASAEAPPSTHCGQKISEDYDKKKKNLSLLDRSNSFESIIREHDKYKILLLAFSLTSLPLGFRLR